MEFENQHRGIDGLLAHCYYVVLMNYAREVTKRNKNTLGEAKKVGVEGKSLKVVSEFSKKNS